MPKRPIDKLRDSAISMEIGDATDASPIREGISLGDRMLVVKEKGIWQVLLADEVDPDRTNADIPNSQQKLIARGSSDALVGRTLLQAKRLLKPGILPSTIPIKDALKTTLSFLTQVDALQSSVDEFIRRTDLLNAAFEASQPTKASLQVPALGDVAVRGKAFIQGADHAVRPIWQLARAFYPDLPPGVSWAKMNKLMRQGDEEEQSVAQMLQQLDQGFIFLRNTRNAVEHPKPGHEVQFQDYRLMPDGRVYTPSIQLVHDSTPMPATDLRVYLDNTIAFLIDSFEVLLIRLCALHSRTRSGLSVMVIELDEGQRRYPHVKYAYATDLGGHLVPYSD